ILMRTRTPRNAQCVRRATLSWPLVGWRPLAGIGYRWGAGARHGWARVARAVSATGMVVVGAVTAPDGASELSAIGDTPNLAARLQALAEPNTVVIADSTRALTRGAFRYVDLGDRKLKGISESMRVWQVAGNVAVSRF